MFFTDDEEYTKYGYFLVNNIKTLSKREAYLFAGKDWSKVKYIFNDDKFSQLDWTKEPEEDIYDLYRQRAQQLREKYDYIVLVYSGGIDSHTILETYLQNNIHVDEIMNFANPELANKTKGINMEIFKSAIPFIQTLDLKKLNTKYRFVDIGRIMLDQNNDQDHLDSFEYYSMNLSYWMGTVNSHKLKASISDHMKLIEQGKSVCYIWGHDKPHMSYDDGKYNIKFSDITAYFGPKQFNNREILKNKFSNFYDEAFYISRETPKIQIKQGHMLRKLMNSIQPGDPRLKRVWEIPIFGPYVQYNNDWYLKKYEVDHCIYPNAIMSQFGDDKIYGGSMLFSRKDNWFYKSNHENKKKYLSKMYSLIRSDPGYFSWRPRSLDNYFNNTESTFDQFNQFVYCTQVVHSKSYMIGKSSGTEQ